MPKRCTDMTQQLRRVITLSVFDWQQQRLTRWCILWQRSLSQLHRFSGWSALDWPDSNEREKWAKVVLNAALDSTLHHHFWSTTRRLVPQQLSLWWFFAFNLSSTNHKRCRYATGPDISHQSSKTTQSKKNIVSYSRGLWPLPATMLPPVHDHSSSQRLTAVGSSRQINQLLYAATAMTKLMMMMKLHSLCKLNFCLVAVWGSLSFSLSLTLSLPHSFSFTISLKIIFHRSSRDSQWTCPTHAQAQLHFSICLPLRGRKTCM